MSLNKSKWSVDGLRWLDWVSSGVYRLPNVTNIAHKFGSFVIVDSYTADSKSQIYWITDIQTAQTKQMSLRHGSLFFYEIAEKIG